MYIIMNSMSLKVLLLMMIGAVPHFALSQVNDAGMWYALDLEKNLNQNMTANVGTEIRLNENISELGTFLTEAGISYRLSKQVAVSVGYRFTQKRRVDDSYSARHRFLVNLNLRHKIERIAIGARIRYQSQYSDVNSSEDGKIPDNYIRTKITAKADLNKRYAPYLSYEAFIHVNRPEGALYDNYRLAAGIEYEFSKKSAIDVGYMIDREINVSDPWTNYVLTVGWSYKL